MIYLNLIPLIVFLGAIVTICFGVIVLNADNEPRNE